jgi:hypothetical protein
VPLVIECMEIQNDLIPTELENMMEEVHKTEGHCKHHHFCGSIAQSDLDVHISCCLC